MSATRRMYSTMLAPRSVAVNLAWSHVRTTNRFMDLPLLVGRRRHAPRYLPQNDIGGIARGLESLNDPADSVLLGGKGQLPELLSLLPASLNLLLTWFFRNTT